MRAGGLNARSQQQWHGRGPGARWQNGPPALQSLFPIYVPMDHLLPAALALLAAYLLGSLSFAVIVSRALGLADPRSYGSGNPGATNVLRSGRKGAALATLALDALKGWLPVFLVDQYGARWGLGPGTAALAGLAAFLGHLYPLFFGFQGGKGVATAGGVLVGIDWLLGLATGTTWLIVAFFFRYSSLASLAAAFFAPAYYVLGAQIAWPWHRAVLLALLVMATLLAWRHRANIRRLIAGQEPRIGAQKKN